MALCSNNDSHLFASNSRCPDSYIFEVVANFFPVTRRLPFLLPDFAGRNWRGGKALGCPMESSWNRRSVWRHIDQFCHAAALPHRGLRSCRRHNRLNHSSPCASSCDTATQEGLCTVAVTVNEHFRHRALKITEIVLLTFNSFANLLSYRLSRGSGLAIVQDQPEPVSNHARTV